jgi:predicted negative regulator of RcsB-dependent stress response
MPPPSQRIKIDRKSLREPDEFQTLTTQAANWASTNQTLVWSLGAALLIVAGLGLGFGWYRARQADAAAVRFQSAHAEFIGAKYKEAADAFAGLRTDYGSTPFGRLAELYRGHSLLRGNDAAGAATAYGEYLASSPETQYLRQEALAGLASARESSGDTAGAVQAYTDAAAIDGPFKQEVRLAMARIAEASGKPEDARAIYRTLLKDNPDPQLKALLESKIPADVVAADAAGTPQ